MAYSIFIDKKHIPGEDEIRAELGSQWHTYQSLAADVRENYSPEAENLHYLYGKKYGWALRFLLKRRMLINLYPNRERFYAQINLPESAVQEALGWDDLRPGFRSVIEVAPIFSEGRWLWFPVQDEADLAEVRRLLELRVKSRGI